jgi:hypothetical protein
VTICDLTRIGVEVADDVALAQLLALGFKADRLSDELYWFKSVEQHDIFERIERLRDLGFAFSTHRHGGADYAIETLREKGWLSGSFLRINFFGSDWEPDAPYRYETF